MITAKTIAEKLNISPSAVSFALNGRPGVSEATRAKVIAEASKLGYKQRKLRPDATQNIRFVIFLGNNEDVIKETSFYSYVLQGLEKCARDLGYNVLVSYYRIDEDITSQIDAISADTLGIVILGTAVNRSYLPQLQPLFDLQLPVVMVDNYIEDFHIDCVVSDNMQGVYNATKYLLQKGYSSLGYIRSKMNIDNFTKRQEGFYKAYNEVNLAMPPVLIDVGISSQRAFDDMSAWLNNGNMPPRALLADNDVIAASCIRALKAHGYRVPGDVAIIGFDNMPICTMIDPPLTAIDVNKNLMGWTAMTLLHNRIQVLIGDPSANDDGTLLIYVSTGLIEREST